MGFAQIEGIAVLPIWLILSPEEKAFFNRYSSSRYHSSQQSLCYSKKIGNKNQSSSKLISDNFFPIIRSVKFLFIELSNMLGFTKQSYINLIVTPAGSMAKKKRICGMGDIISDTSYPFFISVSLIFTTSSVL